MGRFLSFNQIWIEHFQMSHFLGCQKGSQIKTTFWSMIIEVDLLTFLRMKRRLFKNLEIFKAGASYPLAIPIFESALETNMASSLMTDCLIT